MAKVTKTHAKRFNNLAPLMGMDQQQVFFVIEYIKDMDAMRAATAAGLHPDKGNLLLKDKNVTAAISRVLSDRLEGVLIDKEWVLTELRDNHYLARQQGNIPASNKALDQMAKHVTVDAYAADKVEHSGEVGLSIVVKSYGDVIEGEIVQDRELHGASKGGGGQSCGVDPAISFL